MLILTPILGRFLATLFDGKQTFLHPYLGWIENLSYRIGNINPNEEMGWQRYAKSLLLFNLCGLVALFLLEIFQNFLPFNPQHFPNVPWLLAFNTAISFVTNTNWQAYAGETTLSYATQMWGLTVQNFLSAATSLAVLMVLIRGLTRKLASNVGNFWVDIVRVTTYLLLPLSIIFALWLVSEGVVQTLSPYVQAETIEGVSQTIPLGPVASQEAIKMLGSNGGGFFNVNSAHPFENPTPLSNLLETLAILLIPVATVYAYGLLINSRKQAWMLLSVMFIIWMIGFTVASYSENLMNPVLEAYPLMEGKEVRFGVNDSLLWASVTTATSNGSVNAMHSSLSPLAGGIALVNMMLGETVFGGVGVGLCSMLMFVLLTVFLSGLLVGRTPEYLGKKIDKYDIRWIMLAVLTPSALILIGAGISSALPIALSSLSSEGPHGLTELLYTFTSAAANNGSAFAGIEANTNFYNITLSITMLLARLAILISCLGLAGNLVTKKLSPPSAGSLPSDNLVFAGLLFSVIFIVCALTCFPVFSLGPLAEQLLMLKGQSFPLGAPG